MKVVKEIEVHALEIRMIMIVACLSGRFVQVLQFDYILVCPYNSFPKFLLFINEGNFEVALIKPL